MSDFAAQQCKPCEGGVEPLNAQEATSRLSAIDKRWQIDSEGQTLHRQFEFDNYYQTTAFVSAAVWIAHKQDHHPDISFGYKTCEVRYTTHAINGLSDNDFICAARIDQLFA